MSDVVAWKAAGKGMPSSFFAGYSTERAYDESIVVGMPDRKVSIASAIRHEARDTFYFDTLPISDIKSARRQRLERNPISHTEIEIKTADKKVSLKSDYPRMYAFLGLLVLAMIGAGVIGMAFWPSPIMGLFVPVGFTLWAILSYFLRGSGQRNINE